MDATDAAIRIVLDRLFGAEDVGRVKLETIPRTSVDVGLKTPVRLAADASAVVPACTHFRDDASGLNPAAPPKARTLTIGGFKRAYWPGIMRCAVVVPAFMIHTPPPRPFSGSPSDAP